jgi:predicted proteasome-type protease
VTNLEAIIAKLLSLNPTLRSQLSVGMKAEAASLYFDGSKKVVL